MGQRALVLGLSVIVGVGSLACSGSNESRAQEPQLASQASPAAQEPATEEPESTEANANQLVHSELGFSITKPEGWWFHLPQAVREGLDKPRAEKVELERSLPTRSQGPLLFVSPNEDPRAPVPRVRVRLHGLMVDRGGPTAAAEMLLGGGGAFPSYELLQPLGTLEVGGQPAAATVYSFEPEPGQPRQLEQAIFLVRDGVVFEVTLQRPLEHDGSLDDQLNEVARSFTLLP